MDESVRILMTNLVDYAGLFPPAGLPMAEVVTRWARYAAGHDSWMLGRLIVPVSKLDEFEQAVERLGQIPHRGADADGILEPWRISALSGTEGSGGGGGGGGWGDTLNAEIERIFEFNRRRSPDFGDESAGSAPGPGAGGGMVIDTIELKVSNAAQIDAAMRLIPEQLDPFLEIPLAGDVRGLLAAMAGTGARAKVRTGGLTPQAIPATRELAKFLLACAAAEIPFKATAGLHHALRGEHTLTYEKDSPRGVPFGFLNLFVAAALVKAAMSGRGGGGGGGGGEMDAEVIGRVLDEREPRAFVFDKGGVTWRDRRVDTARLARVRESFAVSFGSCSFEEPVTELRALGLVGAE